MFVSVNVSVCVVIRLYMSAPVMDLSRVDPAFQPMPAGIGFSNRPPTRLLMTLNTVGLLDKQW